MPVIVVLGVRNAIDDRVHRFERKLKMTVAGITELGLSEDQVSCFFPDCNGLSRRSRDVIVFIEGLFIREDRTEKVRRDLALAVGKIIPNYLRDAKLIEVFVRPFDPAWGFWSSAEEDVE